jgi:hypothetical protein
MSKKVDLRDVLITARTLGLDSKFEIIFNAITHIA